MSRPATRALTGWSAATLLGAGAADGGPLILAGICLAAAAGFAMLFFAALKEEEDE